MELYEWYVNDVTEIISVNKIQKHPEGRLSLYQYE